MRTWLITGASRGLGLHIAQAALDIGDRVVATSRSADEVRKSLGDSEQLRCLTLDVTDAACALRAVETAVAEFGRIDVLVNNAGYGLFGAFEELSADEVEQQFATNVYGAFNVTKAVLPVMREARAGHIISVSSMSGVSGCPMASVYCATKHALAGWSDSLSTELAPFGISVTAVYPGTFETEFFTQKSLQYPAQAIPAYRALSDLWPSINDGQLFRGAPQAFGRLMVLLARQSGPPRHLPVGSDALDVFCERASSLRAVVDVWGVLAASTDKDLAR